MMDHPEPEVSLRVRDFERKVTNTLGPGVRAVVWVQGCTIGCPGCIVPESWAHRGGTMYDPESLAESLAEKGVRGLTLSGGEPSEQPQGSALLLRKAQALGMDTWVYTGHRLEDLVERKDIWIDRMLSVTDVLVDGPFKRELAGNLVLRGSSNQRILRLTDRIGEDEITGCDPGAHEIRPNAVGQLRLIGIPGPGVLEAIARSLSDDDHNREVRWRK